MHLDLAVAQVDNQSVTVADITVAGEVTGRCMMWTGHTDDFGTLEYSPTTLWEQGGPIIERERISVISLDGEWSAKRIDLGGEFFYVEGWDAGRASLEGCVGGLQHPQRVVRR